MGKQCRHRSGTVECDVLVGSALLITDPVVFEYQHIVNCYRHVNFRSIMVRSPNYPYIMSKSDTSL